MARIGYTRDRCDAERAKEDFIPASFHSIWHGFQYYTETDARKSQSIKQLVGLDYIHKDNIGILRCHASKLL